MFDNFSFYNMLAYLDPGTGSWIIQTLIAGLVGAAFAIKMFWYKIVSACSRLLGKNRNPSDDDQG